MLLHREGVIGPALHRRVVRDDHALVPADAADPGDHPGAGRLVVVHAEGCERGELEECGARVKQTLDALSRQELPALRVTLARTVGAAQARYGEPLAKLRNEAFHRLAVASRRAVARVRR